MNGVPMLVGGEPGLWRAMAGAGPLTAADLARRSEVRERYVREWLAAPAASGCVHYDPEAETFTLLPEEAMAFADEDSPVSVLGGYHVVMNPRLKLGLVPDARARGPREASSWAAPPPS
jgi:hypothetical protein